MFWQTAAKVSYVVFDEMWPYAKYIVRQNDARWTLSGYLLCICMLFRKIININKIFIFLAVIVLFFLSRACRLSLPVVLSVNVIFGWINTVIWKKWSKQTTYVLSDLSNVFASSAPSLSTFSLLSRPFGSSERAMAPKFSLFTKKNDLTLITTWWWGD